MSLRVCAGIIDEPFTIPPGTVVTIDEEDFQSSFGDWRTPGTNDAEGTWSRGSGATPSGSTGPAGGSTLGTRAVSASNAYAYVEASDSGFDLWSLESQTLDASAGTITLAFDVHMRFGAEGNIADGTLRVQGWNGSEWANIGAAITGSKQSSASEAWLASTVFGTYDSSAFSNSDFKIRFLAARGASQFTVNYDFALDNIKLVGPEDAVPDAAPTGFDTGLRRLHVSQDGTPPEDGSTPDRSFTTIQAGLNALRPGDVMTIADGRYFETLSLSNFAGTASLPAWIVAENRGEVIVSNLRQDVFEGTAVWRNEGGNIYSLSGSSPFVGWKGDNQMLPRWFLSDLQDSNFFASQSTSGIASVTLLKPDRGIAFSNGRIYCKLEDGSNPTGQSVSITRNFGTVQCRLTNADHVILDGLIFEGGGDGGSMNIDQASRNPTMRNCVFTGCQFGIQFGCDNLLMEWCEFQNVPGHTDFHNDLRALNGQASNAIFRYHKDYYYGQRFGFNNNRFDTVMGGGFDAGNAGQPGSNIRMTHCLMHECFDGSKFGRCRSGEQDNNVFLECLDDGVELEASGGGSSGSGQIRFHDNLLLNCFSMISHQGTVLHTDHFVYRNVLVADDPPIAHPAFFIKSLKTPASVDIHYYHNTMINLSANGDTNDGFGTNHWVWFGFSAPNGDADKIDTWRSNIVVFPNDLDSAQTNPRGRRNNVVVSPSNNSQSQVVQGTNGTYAGNLEADMDLNSDYSLGASSPAIGAGAGSIPGGFPDSRTGAGRHDDAGAFPDGETPGSDWPRPSTRTFSETLPPSTRWPQPGV